MPLAPGSLAPDFTLPMAAREGLRHVALASHRGQDVVVLLFFPAVNTPVCTREMCQASEDVPALRNAVVYGISADLPYAQEMWAKTHGISAGLLSDHSLKVSRAYDVVWPDFGGFPVAARASFVIDRQGVIVYAEQTPTLGDLPDFAQLEVAVQAAASDRATESDAVC